MLFRPGDSADLTAKVRELLGNPQRLLDMRTACRQEFEAKYTAEQNVRRLIEIYRRAMAPHPDITTAAIGHDPELPLAEGKARGYSLPVLPPQVPLGPDDEDELHPGLPPRHVRPV